jgi:uncharacterized membrane protein HdeD (DUF308 family)
MSYKLYLMYAHLFKVIASVLGVVCVLEGVNKIFAIWMARDAWDSRLMGVYILVAGVIWLIPNRFLDSKARTLVYCLIALLNTAGLLAWMAHVMGVQWDNFKIRNQIFLLMVFFAPAALTAPGSLVLYVIGHKKRLQHPQ